MWPLLLWLLWKARGKLMFVMVSFAAISFAINIWEIKTDAVADFYSPLTRFWELLIGSFLAHYILSRNGAVQHYKPIRNNVLAFVGAGLLVVGMLIVTREQEFPGWWALFPTLGTALIIFAGATAWLNRTVLSSRILVWFGLISFPLYLWHWPILSFLRIVENGAPSKVVRIVAVLVSTVLAWSTYRLVERPIRFGKNSGSSEKKVYVLGAAMICILIAGLLAYSKVIPVRNNNSSAQMIGEAVGDWEYPSGLAHKKYLGEDLYYSEGGERISFMFGDSHVEQYSPRIVRLAGGARVGHSDFNSVYWGTYSGCPPIPNVYDDNRKGCNGLREAALTFIEQSSVTKVIVGACWNCYFIDGETGDSGYYYLNNGTKEKFLGGRGRELAMLELESLLKRLAKSKKVYLLLDNPSGEKYNPKSFFEGSRLTEIRVMPKSQTTFMASGQLDLHAKMLGLGRRAGVEIIDPVEMLCKGSNCLLATVDGRPIYKDDEHLRPFFVREEVKYMDAAFTSN